MFLRFLSVFALIEEMAAAFTTAASGFLGQARQKWVRASKKVRVAGWGCPQGWPLVRMHGLAL